MYVHMYASFCLWRFIQEADVTDVSDVTDRESTAKTAAEDLEEDDCQVTEDIRSDINIEHGENDEHATSHIGSDLVSIQLM